MQHEILERKPLLDKNGNIAEPGWARALVSQYRRADIKAARIRIKEWDYYLVSNDTHAVALTIADNGYMGLISASLIDFTKPWEQTTSVMTAFPMGRFKLPESSSFPWHKVTYGKFKVFCTPMMSKMDMWEHVQGGVNLLSRML